MMSASLARARQLALRLTLSVGLLLAASSTAHAAAPTIEQCLQASDASLELETQDELLRTRDALRICASLNCPAEVRDECARRIELVEQNIPGVLCEVREESGRIRHDAQITIDGRASAAASHELIELEPGPHTLVASAPGLQPITLKLTLKTREKNRQVRFVLPPTGGLPPRRTAALVAGGLGVASLATASVFAVIALNRKQEARALCPGATCSTTDGSERWDSARQAGNLSTGFVVGGVVALGAAAGLWWSFGKSSTAVALGPAQVHVKAAF